MIVSGLKMPTIVPTRFKKITRIFRSDCGARIEVTIKRKNYEINRECQCSKCMRKSVFIHELIKKENGN